jgi:hypothetical protein
MSKHLKPCQKHGVFAFWDLLFGHLPCHSSTPTHAAVLRGAPGTSLPTEMTEAGPLLVVTTAASRDTRRKAACSFPRSQASPIPFLLISAVMARLFIGR